jgi:methionyl aminopeptidase
MAIPLRTPREIGAIANVAASLWRVLVDVSGSVRAGLTTAEVDAMVRAGLQAAGLTPALPGYSQSTSPPYPAASCVSVNEHVVHAVPGPRILNAGDIVTIDIAASAEAPSGAPSGPFATSDVSHGPWFADAATSVTVGESGAESDGVRARRLCAAARAVSEAAIASAGPGVAWRVVADAARVAANVHKVHLIPRYCGHGIGRRLHEQPRLDLGPSPEAAEELLVLRPGMVLTIEPIVVESQPGVEPRVHTLADAWTVATESGLWAAHEERMIAVTRLGVQLLTA